MITRILCILFVLGYSLSLTGQENVLSDATVETVLLEVEERYQVRFSYSKEIVPYHEPVREVVFTNSLNELLEDLTVKTGIIYSRRGSRIILNYDPSQKVVAAINPDADLAYESVPSVRDEITESIVTFEAQEPLNQESSNIDEEKEATSEKPGEKRVESLVELGMVRSNPVSREVQYQEDLARLNSKEDIHFMQVSFVPTKLNRARKSKFRNRLSLNIIAGYTGGVEGLEVGGFTNGVKRDVHGMQFAGFGNVVGGNVQGGQVSGFFNYNRGIMRGLQMAGFANVNEQADAFQFAGAFNFNHRVSRGLQAAGFFNSGRYIAGVQLAGFFNLALGNINGQASGFCNVAEDVDVQLTGFVNVAKKVGVLQVGLVNVADTVSGISIGLVNLIKHGYNKVEISGGDAMYANLALKLGTTRFYNIFQVGTNFRRDPNELGMIWGYGYGFGFLNKLNNQVRLNPEVIVMQVNERGNRILTTDPVPLRRLQNELNLLGQLKLLLNIRNSGSTEIVAGPTLNISISKVENVQGLDYGTSIAPYTIWDKTYIRDDRPLNTKVWIGFSAGIRL